MGQESDERRRADRLMVELPVHGRVGVEGDYLDLEVVDIGLGGMQIKSRNFGALQNSLNPERNIATFDLRLRARLARAQPESDGAFLTGWEFAKE